MIMYGSLHDVAAANSSYIPNCTLAVWYYYFFTKVRKIAPIFYLDFSSIYLIKEFDNQAVFQDNLDASIHHRLTRTIRMSDPLLVSTAATSQAAS